MEERTLAQRLADIDQSIDELKREKERLIAIEPLTFHLLSKPRFYANERYVVVYGSGEAAGWGSTYTQRPAALRHARFLTGRYVWDTREGVILDGEGHTIATTDAQQ